MDMLCHWRYVLDQVFGPVKAVSCLGATHIPERIDENGKPYCQLSDKNFDKKILISLSHTKDYAIANAIITSE